MKILIRDYSSEHSTEPQDLYIALKKIGAEVALWDENKRSAFDALDKFNPDLLINSGDFSNALRKRLRLCEIPVIHRLKADEEDFVKSWFKERAITHKEPSPCNIFINELIEPTNVFRGKIDHLIVYQYSPDFVYKSEQNINEEDTRHVISTVKDRQVGTYLPMGQVYAIGNNYENIFVSDEFPDAFKLNLALMGYNVDGVSQYQAVTRTAYDFLIKIIGGHLAENKNSNPVNNILVPLYNACEQARKHIESNFNVLDSTK